MADLIHVKGSCEKGQLSTLVVLEAGQDLTNVDAVTESSGSAGDFARVLLVLSSFFA
jgi:hypothetical protein